MKKQVEGHTSKQTPANRTIYEIRIKYTKFVNGANPTSTYDFVKAYKWYINGNNVSIIDEKHGFKMERGKGIYYNDNGELSSMLPIINVDTYDTINKKTNPLQDRHIRHIEHNNGTSKLVCTF